MPIQADHRFPVQHLKQPLAGQLATPAVEDRQVQLVTTVLGVHECLKIGCRGQQGRCDVLVFRQGLEDRLQQVHLSG